MRTVLRKSLKTAIILVMTLTLGILAYAQDTDTDRPISVPAGQTMTIEGVILNHQTDNLTLRTSEKTLYTVMLSDAVLLKEKKINPFRSSKKYLQTSLVPGLRIEVKGAGNDSGVLAAKEIRIKNEDIIAALTIDTRVQPVENNLRDTQKRLGETEQNSRRLSGQVLELSDISNTARSGAKTAQDTADHALSAASNAQVSADKAAAGVRSANERITQLDDFDIKDTAKVYFTVGSSQLSEENKAALNKFAEQITMEKGYVIEIFGFASADGASDANRSLSQKRAENVIQYLAENSQIPLRRFILPMGYGETRPAGDNNTSAGRKENRRVEIRLLVSKGFNNSSEIAESSGGRIR
jgi:OmpA-OmpF porin, OOP family